MSIRIVLFTVLTVSVVGCSSGQNLIAERQRTTPPQNAQDVGTVLEGADIQQVNGILQKHPGAQVRTLNAPHGMYEIFGVDTEQVKLEYGGTAERNQFFHLNEAKAKLFSIPLPEGFQAGSLVPCTTATGSYGPTAVLTAESPIAALDGATIEIGKTVKFDGLKSLNTAGATAPLKMVMAVQFPDAAIAPQTVQDGTALQFTPDTLGLHQAFVVVQDANGNCAIDGIQFIVTANRPYNGANAADVPVDLTQFQHLAQVSAQQSWNVSQGEGMVIAVIDTGVNYNHPLLAGQIQINKGEIPANGIDDDKNGFIDDYVGYDFANQDPYPYDDDSHGTHVAGLAVAKHFGMAQGAKVLPVKAMTPVGGDIGTIAAAMRYAVDRGANILSMSIGAETPIASPLLVSAANYAEQKGVLVVVAAGNGDQKTGIGFDLDSRHVFPASLSTQNANLMAVAAFDSKNVLSPYSNYGAKSVDVVGPGGFTDDLLISCAFENPRGALFIGMAGTSMATPVVSGIAAQVWSRSPNLKNTDVKNILIGAGPVASELQGKTISGRHIDALAAVAAAGSANVLF